MSDEFDAYHEWLGIPPKDQPPHHYRMLGIELFEAIPKVIESAADRQMAHVRTFQSGKRAAISQQLLNEISAARVCLLIPEKKLAYDESLRKTLQSPAARPVATAAPVATVAEPRSDPAPEPLASMPAVVTPRKQPVRKSKSIPSRAMGIGAVACLLLFLGAFFIVQIATANGELVIESQEPGIQVVVKRGKEPVESITLSQKKNRTIIRTGDYHVEVLGAGADKLVVENETFTISRGDTVVVKIYRKQEVAQRPARVKATGSSPPPLISTAGDGSTAKTQSKGRSTPPPDSVNETVTSDSAGAAKIGGAASLPKPGQEGYALQFSGNHSVEIEGSQQVASMNGELTAELWAKWPTDKAPGDVVGTFKPAKHGWDVTFLLSKANRFGIGLRFCGQDAPRGVGAGVQYQAPPSHDWHHLAFTKKASNEIIVYLDGKPSWQGKWTAGVDDAVHNLRLGAHQAAFSTGFHGQIRAFRLSSICRYTQPFIPPTPVDMTNDDSTEVLLDFAHPEASVVRDLSGKGRHGKIVGAQWLAIGDRSAESPGLAAEGTPLVRCSGHGSLEVAETSGLVSLRSVFTAEMWVRWPDDGDDFLFGTYASPKVIRKSPCGWSIKVSTAGGKSTFTTTNEATGSLNGTDATAGQWHHLAYMVDAQGWRSLFVDGKRLSYGSSRPAQPDMSNLCLGVPRLTLPEEQSRMEVRAFRLSSSAIYEPGFTPQPMFERTADTEVLLDFSQPPREATIRDISGNDRHATLINAEWIPGDG